MAEFKYTKAQQDELLASMVIVVDTREQENSHIIKSFDGGGYTGNGSRPGGS